jgi:deazaflavin-dependent oxidoreductase (nitroreductase family)
MRLYDDFIERFASSKIGSWMFLNVFTHLDRWLIRASGGRLSTGVGSRFHSHGVVLETRGAKSGKLRRVPLVTLISGNDWTLIASATGQAKNPAWYYNLKKNPEAFLYHRGEAIPVFAREAVGQERDRIYASAIEFASNFAVYRDRTERTIPVMVLSRRTDVG